MVLVFLFLLLMPPVAHAFKACAPGYYGQDCGEACRCADHEDCDDGPLGDGSCACALDLCASVPSLPPLPSWLAGLRLGNRTLSAMSVDPETRRYQRQVYDAGAARVLPKPFRAERLRLLAVDRDVAAALDGLALPTSALLEGEGAGGRGGERATDGAAIAAEAFSGRRLLPGSRPFAHACTCLCPRTRSARY